MTVLSAECWREHRSYPGTTAPLNATDPLNELDKLYRQRQAELTPKRETDKQVRRSPGLSHSAQAA